MADPTTNLRVRISADLADIKSGLTTLRRDLAAVKTQAATAFPNNNSFVNGIRSARNELRSFIGAYLSLRGVGILAGIADEATQLRGRIREAKGDYEGILALAQRTRGGLSATVDLYSRLERSTRGQIDNQQRLLGITETVNQAVKLSYTGAQQGAAGVMQLGQALGSGNLGGDELKSLRENVPRLAQAIADGMGVSIGKLKELGKEGKLATLVVVKALESQAAAVASEFGRVPVTIGDALTQIKNALIDYVGDQDAATGASKRFAKTLQDVAKDLPRYLDPLLKAIQLLLENLDTLIVYLGVRLAGGAIASVVLGFARLIAIINAARTATISLRVAMIALGGPVGIVLAGLAAGLFFLYKKTNEAKVAAEEHSKALAANAALSRDSAQAALAEAQAKRAQAMETVNAAKAILAEKRARLVGANDRANLIVGEGRFNQTGRNAAVARGEAEKAQNQVAQAQKQLDDWTGRMVKLAVEIQMAPSAAAQGMAKVTDDATDKAKKVKKEVKGIVDLAELAQDAIKRQLQVLDDLLKNNGIRLADYYAKKKALQEADIDAQIEQAQAEAKTATSSDQQSRALTNIIKLQRDRAAIATSAAKDQAEAEEELAKKIGDVQIRLLEASGQTARARTAQLEAEFIDMFRQLEIEGDETGKRLVRKLINLEASKAQLQQFQTQSQEVLGQLRASETSLSAQAQAGMLGQIEGQRQIDEQRTIALDKLRLLRESMLSYLVTLSPGSPEHAAALLGLQQLNGDIANIVSSQQRLRQQVADTATGALTTFFTDLTDSTKSFKDAFKDLVRNFIAGMAQIAARALATYLVLQLLDAIYPGLGKATAAGMSAGVKHSGGIVGAGGTIRSGMSPFLFGGAPRYHSGGIAGLAPNEVPAVLEKGEEILAKNNPRHRDNGGGQGRTIVKTPIVAIGDRAVADAMAGTAGEETIVTHVMNNWDRITRGRE